MVTKAEFKQLKEKYWTKEYHKKAIIITDDLPNRLIVITPHYENYRWGGFDSKVEKHQIIEYNSKGRKTYYGTNGRVIMGTYTQKEVPIENIVISGRKARDAMSFFFAKTVQHPPRLDELDCVFRDKFQEFIRDLRRIKVNPKGLYSFCRYRFYYISNPGQSITHNEIYEAFGIKPKDLKELIDNYGNVYNRYTDIGPIVYGLKELFKTSVKNIVPYIGLEDYCSKGYSYEGCVKTYSSDEKKQLREELNYLVKVKNVSIDSLRSYRDYRRMRQYLAEETRKAWPLYPKDVTKIDKLHTDIINFYNNEQDKIREAQQAEKQAKYTKNVYEKAKKFELSDDNYCIIACKNLIDLVKEGRTLHHCVGSYVDSVSMGKEYILFLRKKEEIDTPFYTIDITPDRKVRQIHGLCNCNITDDIKPFIELWAKKFNLNISNCSGVHCALC